MMAALDKISSISYTKPDGAIYIFCDFSKVGNATLIAQQILNDVKVAVIPGESFGAPNFVRLSFATSSERILEGMKRIDEWIKKNTSH